jgi:hypothetical protein
MAAFGDASAATFVEQIVSKPSNSDATLIVPEYRLRKRRLSHDHAVEHADNVARTAALVGVAVRWGWHGVERGKCPTIVDLRYC